MKRDPALAALSREHHQALFVAQSLKRATEEERRTARDRFASFWRTEGKLHFRIEEELLLPAYAGHVDPHDPSIARTLCEHVAIRALASRVISEREPAAELLASLGDHLRRHVRFEERELFPAIEAAMPHDELVELGAAMEQAERVGDDSAR